MSFTPRRSEAYEEGLSLWLSLHERERSGERIHAEFAQRGVTVSKATVYRWTAGWRQAAQDVLDLIELPLGDSADSSDLTDVPEWARKALPERLLRIAGGRGLDRVERAVALLSDAIGSKAPDIIDRLLQGDQKVVLVFQAISTIAVIAQRLAHVRAAVAVTHRNFCEGDLAAAKAKAIAETGQDRAQPRADSGSTEDQPLSQAISEKAQQGLNRSTVEAPSGGSQ